MILFLHVLLFIIIFFFTFVKNHLLVTFDVIYIICTGYTNCKYFEFVNTYSQIIAKINALLR